MNYSHHYAISLTLLSLAVSSAAASTIRSDVSDSLYTTLAASEAYSGVGKVYETTSSGTYAGSGTLLSSEWVLTAAHMVTDASSAGSLTYVINGVTYTADSYTYYSGYSSSTLSGDLALVHLSSAVTGVTYATLYTGTTSSLTGQTATYVGYGTTGTGTTGYQSGTYGTKRAVQNIIDAVGSSVSGTNWPATDLISDFDSPSSSTDPTPPQPNAPDLGPRNGGRRPMGPGGRDHFRGPGSPMGTGEEVTSSNANTQLTFTNQSNNTNRLGDATPLDLEGLIAPGDSGGGVFVTIDGVTYLAGVISFLGYTDGTANANYGDYSGAVSVTEYLNWIYSITGLNSASDSLSMLSAAVPEPSALFLLSFGSMALLTRRSRRAR